MTAYNTTYLKQLEAESIYIIRETVATCQNSVLLYSVGKDSSVIAHLAKKAFAPGKIPFPFLHVDTTFKFSEMYEFRDSFTQNIGAELIVYINKAALDSVGSNPEDWDCYKCANLLKTQALIDAITKYGFDAAIGGARRDEEKSRAKERVFSFRDKFMQWNPKNQRPELWNLYNTRLFKNESLRVFPLSNWTELDVWHYIYTENIPVLSLYYAKKRDVIRRDGMLLIAGDLNKPRRGECIETIKCRLRSVGCQLCTGAIPSNADTLPEIIQEIMLTTCSERQTRAVDLYEQGAMETKKRDGYF